MNYKHSPTSAKSLPHGLLRHGPHHSHVYVTFVRVWVIQKINYWEHLMVGQTFLHSATIVIINQWLTLQVIGHVISFGLYLCSDFLFMLRLMLNTTCPWLSVHLYIQSSIPMFIMDDYLHPIPKFSAGNSGRLCADTDHVSRIYRY